MCGAALFDPTPSVATTVRLAMIGRKRNRGSGATGIGRLLFTTTELLARCRSYQVIRKVVRHLDCHGRGHGRDWPRHGLLLLRRRGRPAGRHPRLAADHAAETHILRHNPAEALGFVLTAAPHSHEPHDPEELSACCADLSWGTTALSRATGIREMTFNLSNRFQFRPLFASNLDPLVMACAGSP